MSGPKQTPGFRGRSAATAAALFLGLLCPPAAQAIDGLIEISQAKISASGGFPYVISSADSYVLTSNLTVPGANTNAIDINVTGQAPVESDHQG